MEKQHILVKMKSDDTELEFGHNIVTITVSRDYWVERERHTDALNRIDKLKKENMENTLRLNEKIDEKNTKILSLNKLVEYKENEMKGLEIQIERLEAENGDLELMLEKKRNEVEILAAEVNRLGNDKARYQVESLMAELKEYKDRCFALEKVYEANVKLVAENDQLKTEIDNLKSIIKDAKIISVAMSKTLGVNVSE